MNSPGCAFQPFITYILARVRLVKKHVAKGRLPTPRCGDLLVPTSVQDAHLRLIKKLQPPCVASGFVAFGLMTAHSQTKGTVPQSMREWLTCGLCWHCQRAIFA